MMIFLVLLWPACQWPVLIIWAYYLFGVHALFAVLGYFCY
uniref:Uncharacterized protein n=1 Tax=Rhizophora mucronata TaxID=61149 RepID=A0A2P2L5E5_RHIMU